MSNEILKSLENKLFFVLTNKINGMNLCDGKLKDIENEFQKYIENGGCVQDIENDIKTIDDKMDKKLFNDIKRLDLCSVRTLLTLHPPLISKMFELEKSRNEKHVRTKKSDIIHMFSFLIRFNKKQQLGKKEINKWFFEAVRELGKHMNLGAIKRNKDTYEQMSFLHTVMWRYRLFENDDELSNIMNELIKMKTPICTDLISDYKYLKDKIPKTCNVIEAHLQKMQMSKEINKEKGKNIKVKIKKI